MASITTCVFDAYGTLFDVHSAVHRHAERIGPRAVELSRLWRARQTEYSWTRSLMHRHADFWVLTQEALDYALAAHGIRDSQLRAALLSAYLELSAFPEVPAMLKALKNAGMNVGILSNGTHLMVNSAVKSAGISDLIDFSLSIDDAGVFKPDARVYQLVTDQCRVAPGEVAFGSSNPWDAAGAGVFGFRVFWVNRTGAPREYSLDYDLVELSTLEELPMRLKSTDGA